MGDTSKGGAEAAARGKILVDLDEDLEANLKGEEDMGNLLSAPKDLKWIHYGEEDMGNLLSAPKDLKPSPEAQAQDSKAGEKADLKSGDTGNMPHSASSNSIPCGTDKSTTSGTSQKYAKVCIPPPKKLAELKEGALPLPTYGDTGGRTFALGKGVSDASILFISVHPMTAALQRNFLQRALIVMGCGMCVLVIVEIVALDARPLVCFANMLEAFGFWLSIFLARRGASRRGVQLIGMSATLASLCFMMADVLAIQREEQPYLVHCLISLVVAYVFLVDEAFFLRGFALVGILCIVCFIYFISQSELRIDFMIIGVFGIAIPVSFSLRRRIALYKSFKDLEPDRKRYENLYHEIRENQMGDLVALNDTAKGYLHRKNVQRKGTGSSTLGDKLEKAGILKEAKVKPVRVCQPSGDVNALFQMARSLNDWYQQVIGMWAQELGVEHHSAKVKSTARVLQKSERSYAGKVRRVVDFVRSSMVVKSIADANRCLEHVIRHARIFNIKNRYNPGFDGKATGGYRDINLQLSFEDLSGSVFSGFVFELQIILADYLTIKSDEGHRRYITCRNLRGD